MGSHKASLHHTRSSGSLSGRRTSKGLCVTCVRIQAHRRRHADAEARTEVRAPAPPIPRTTGGLRAAPHVRVQIRLAMQKEMGGTIKKILLTALCSPALTLCLVYLVAVPAEVMRKVVNENERVTVTERSIPPGGVRVTYTRPTGSGDRIPQRHEIRAHRFEDRRNDRTRPQRRRRHLALQRRIGSETRQHRR